MPDEYELLVDLHRGSERQGPGGTEQTLRAIELAGLDRSATLKIADLGCGTGAAAKVLARSLRGEVLAVDTAEPFLSDLRAAVQRDQSLGRITTLACSIDELPFGDGELDVIWSEGAVYAIGFEAGVSRWIRYLRPGGTLVVSELTWLTGRRPAELEEHWTRHYPEVDVASAKIGVLERHGYRPEAYFVLPAQCWLQNYYEPLEARFDEFLERHDHSADASAVVAEHREEIELYRAYSQDFGYGVYVASRPRD
jgi:SAM-dependent methyltransferase